MPLFWADKFWGSSWSSTSSNVTLRFFHVVGFMRFVFGIVFEGRMPASYSELDQSQRSSDSQDNVLRAVV